MKRFLCLSFVLLSLSLFSQSRQSLLSAALKNSSPGDSSFLLRDSVLAHIYYDAESDSILLSGLKDVPGLTQADADYMRMQLQHYRAHCWTADSIPNTVIVPSSAVPAAALSAKKSAKAWTKYYATYHYQYFEMSEPVFSKDGMYAIVYTAQQCGSNCGNGGATLFHFEKGQWRPVKNLFSFSKQGAKN